MTRHCWLRLRRHSFVGTGAVTTALCVFCGGADHPATCGCKCRPVICTECGRRTEKWTLS